MFDHGFMSRRRFTTWLAKLTAMVSATYALPAGVMGNTGSKDDDGVSLAHELSGDVIPRGHEDYDVWRHSMTWQLRKTPRRPDVIVRAKFVNDVVAAVKYANENKLKIAVRSGGHNWVSASVRDGGMLLDLGSFRDLNIDADATSAVVGPSIRARELAGALERVGLAFPVAHCSSVALGGYLLGGGQGWNWGSWGGPACNSIEALDVVDARGEVIRVDENNYSDLFWAARGAYTGLPAIVLNYHLKLYPLPKAIHLSSYTWPLADALAVSRWLPKVGAALSDKVELYMFLLTLPKPVDDVRKAVSVSAVAFADTPDEARELLAPMSEANSLGNPVIREEVRPETFNSLLDRVDRLYPPCRAAVDTFWFDLPMEEVMARYVDHFAAAPSPLSNVLCEVKPKPIILPDMAYSMRRLTYLSPYSLWLDENDDEANIAWMKRTQEILAPLSVGHYVNEADLEAGPERARRSYTEQNWQRIMDIRQKYDPNGVFHTYLGVSA